MIEAYEIPNYSKVLFQNLPQLNFCACTLCKSRRKLDSQCAHYLVTDGSVLAQSWSTRRNCSSMVSKTASCFTDTGTALTEQQKSCLQTEYDAIRAITLIVDFLLFK